MRRLLLAVPLLALGLAGCYESTGVTMHEPAEYKGAQDPLHDKLADEAHREELDARSDGQRDR